MHKLYRKILLSPFFVTFSTCRTFLKYNTVFLAWIWSTFAIYRQVIDYLRGMNNFLKKTRILILNRYIFFLIQVSMFGLEGNDMTKYYIENNQSLIPRFIRPRRGRSQFFTILGECSLEMRNITFLLA